MTEEKTKDDEETRGVSSFSVRAACPGSSVTLRQNCVLGKRLWYTSLRKNKMAESCMTASAMSGANIFFFYM